MRLPSAGRRAVVVAAALALLFWLPRIPAGALSAGPGRTVTGCDSAAKCADGPSPGAVPWAGADADLRQAVLTCFKMGNGWEPAGSSLLGPTGYYPNCDKGHRYKLKGERIWGLSATDYVDNSKLLLGSWAYGCLKNNSVSKSIGQGAQPSGESGWNLESWGLLPEPNATRTPAPNSKTPSFELYGLNEVFWNTHGSDEALGMETHTVFAKYGYKVRPAILPVIWRVSMSIDVGLIDVDHANSDVWVTMPLTKEAPKMAEFNGGVWQVTNGYDDAYPMTAQEGSDFCGWTA
jgi:hypothetical protein